MSKDDDALEEGPDFEAICKGMLAKAMSSKLDSELMGSNKEIDISKKCDYSALAIAFRIIADYITHDHLIMNLSNAGFTSDNQFKNVFLYLHYINAKLTIGLKITGTFNDKSGIPKHVKITVE